LQVGAAFCVSVMFRWGNIQQSATGLWHRARQYADIFHPPARRVFLLAAIHVAAMAIMYWSEDELFDRATFVLVWIILNCFWLTLLRRYTLSALLSLTFVVLLVMLSRLKHEIVFMTINFFDVLIIDSDTFAFLLNMFPHLGRAIMIGCVVAVPVVIWAWRHDPLHVRRRHAALVGAACFGVLIWVSAFNRDESWHVFRASNYVSKFARSGVETVADLSRQGWFDAEAAVAGRISTAPQRQCHLAARPPHIILVHDESSFDIRAVNGVKVPAGYGKHFHSYDGQERQFLVESNGGSSWFAEYNVLTGLSSRSFGRLAFFLTRVAAGRVKRGLPLALERCDYRTYSLYPAHGAFMSARQFHKTTGVEYFFDAKDLGTNKTEPDSFYFNAAAKLIGDQHSLGPMFVYVYLAANHYPWMEPFRGDLTPGWQNPGNSNRVDEYLRRQSMSEHDYAAFLAQLKERFPQEAFLIVRYGDHQPEFTTELIEPGIDERTLAQRMESFDARYFTTYYAVDTVNYTPPATAILPQILDAPYMPLVIQELAGLPLDPSFVEQKEIFERCEGIFYGCHNGAEARRFNRMLIDAGIIKGL
jgi:phosphoglycerol transferase MdoB-like AlkP superfamily enzyme